MSSCSSATSATNDTSPSPTRFSNSATTAGESWEARSRASGSVHLRPPAGRLHGHPPEAGLRREVQPRDAADRGAAPVPAAVRWPARLRLAEVGAVGREVRVPRPLGRAVQARTVAVRLGAGVRPGTRLARRARPARRDADHARRRLHADRRRVEQGRLRELGPLAARRGPGTQRPLLLPRVDRHPAGSSRSPGSSPRRSRTAPVAVLASNITWNAYNNFGGRSNYIHADGLPPTPTVNSRPELKRYSDAGLRHLGRRRVPAALVRPARAVQPHRLRRADHRPDRGPAGVPPRPGRVAAARLARTRGLRLRLLRRDAAPRRHARPVAVPRPGPRGPPRILDAADVRPREALGLRGGRPAHVPRRQRAELRGRIAARSRAWSATTASSRVYRSRGWAGTRAGSRMRHESEANLLGVVFTPAGAMTGAPYRVVDAAHWAFAGTGLRRRRHVRREVPAHALPRRRVGARDGQGLAELADEREGCSRRG